MAGLIVSLRELGLACNDCGSVSRFRLVPRVGGNTDQQMPRREGTGLFGAPAAESQLNFNCRLCGVPNRYDLVPIVDEPQQQHPTPDAIPNAVFDLPETPEVAVPPHRPIRTLRDLLDATQPATPAPLVLVPETPENPRLIVEPVVVQPPQHHGRRVRGTLVLRRSVVQTRSRTRRSNGLRVSVVGGGVGQRRPVVNAVNVVNAVEVVRDAVPLPELPVPRQRFMCPEPGCDKGYLQRKHLNQHMITHGPKMHVCQVCRTAFHHRFNLVRHQQNIRGCAAIV